MKYLNLDNTFTPFGKSIAYEAFTFNGGEPHIKILADLKANDEVMITTRIQNFNDVGFLLLANDALRRMGIRKISLFLPYFPAARQDRVMVTGEPLSVKVYADIINAADFYEVIIVDPHSEVTSALLNNVVTISNHEFVAHCLEGMNDCVLISPDGGALKKIYKVAAFMDGVPVVECSKMRDVKTGKLSGFTVYADDLKGATCVIVDDICDGGGTFLGLATELKAKNAGDLILIVTHGIFSKGLDTLSSVFDKIYSTNSFIEIENTSTFQQINLKEIISNRYPTTKELITNH